MNSSPVSLTVKSLRFLMNQIPQEHDDKEIAVLLPHVGRRFPIVAVDDDLDPRAPCDKSEEAPYVLIAHRRPHA